MADLVFQEKRERQVFQAEMGHLEFQGLLDLQDLQDHEDLKDQKVIQEEMTKILHNLQYHLRQQKERKVTQVLMGSLDLPDLQDFQDLLDLKDIQDLSVLMAKKVPEDKKV